MFYLNENCEVLFSSGAVKKIDEIDGFDLKSILCTFSNQNNCNSLSKSVKNDCDMVTLVVTSAKRVNPYSITCSLDTNFRLQDGSVINILDCKKRDNLLTYSKDTVRVELVSEVKSSQKGYSLRGENLMGYYLTPLGVEVVVNN